MDKKTTKQEQFVDFSDEVLRADKIQYAAQEWGIENNLRLFGVTVGDMDFHGVGGPAERVAFRAKAYFTDPAFKVVELHIFDVKKKNGIVTVSKMKAKQNKALFGFRWPIGFARTRDFQNDVIIPTDPLYDVLVSRGLILPFRSRLKYKEWQALPFEDRGDMKSERI